MRGLGQRQKVSCWRETFGSGSLGAGSGQVLLPIPIVGAQLPLLKWPDSSHGMLVKRLPWRMGLGLEIRPIVE